jgi:hypothetical protein
LVAHSLLEFGPHFSLRDTPALHYRHYLHDLHDLTQPYSHKEINPAKGGWPQRTPTKEIPT